jgi:hypothetical protein
MLSCCCFAALILPPPLLCCRRRSNAGRVNRRVTTKLSPLSLLPRRRHRHHHATASTKLLPLPLSTLRDKFDNEKEFCNNAGTDYIQLSQLFQVGIEFLHGGMRSIFNALVCLSLYYNNL